MDPTGLTIKFKKFLAWWWQGIRYLLPENISLWSSNRHFIFYKFIDGQVSVQHYSGNLNQATDTRIFSIENENEKSELSHYIREKTDKNTTFILLLEKDKLLNRKLSLPLAAKNTLRAVLNYEIERITPFISKDVYFDFFILEENLEKKLISLDLWVVPKMSIDPIREQLGSLDCAVTHVCPADLISIEHLIKVCSPESNGDNDKSENINWLLPAVTFTLFLAWLYLPLLNYESRINVLNEELNSKRQLLDQARILQRKDQNLQESIDFMPNKINQYQSPLDTLLELTTILSNEIWANRLSINKGEVQLQGEATAASTVIHAIESSELFNTSDFRSPVTQNNKTGKEKYHLYTSLVQEGVQQ